MIIYVDSYGSDAELEFIAKAVSEKYGTEFRVFRRYYSKGIEQIGEPDVALRAEYEKAAQQAACDYEYK
jgi:hypothetical protein